MALPRLTCVLRGPASPAAEPLDALLERFYGAVARVGCGPASPDIPRLAGAAMERCLTQNRPADAVDVYEAVCRTGLTAAAPGGPAALDHLAVTALRRLPHRTRFTAAAAQLLDAEWECESEKGAHPPPAPSPPPPLSDVSAAECFRVGLRQRVNLLRAVGQLQQPLGRNYLLMEARNVLDTPALRVGAEVEPLLFISAALLHHPHARDGPPAAADALFDHLGAAPAASSEALSVVQREGLVGLEAAVSPLRPLCRPTLRFLTAVAAEWDAVLHRRVAEELLLPPEAHDVFPRAYSERRRHDRAVHRRLLDSPRPAPHHNACATKWTGAAHRLFPPLSTAARHAAPLQCALGRVDDILRRRVRRDIVVPDAPYVLQSLPQLLQLGRHREVVLTHSVVLELTAAALRPACPRRFAARRALRHLMLHSTTAATPRPAMPPPSASRHAISARRDSDGSAGGVTVLGLQDELALLQGCGPTEPLAGGDSDAARAQRSAVLVAQKLSAVLSAHAQGASAADVADQAAAGGLVADADSLIDGIVGRGGAAPLFQSRSRTFWSGVPVLVATTSAETRSAAYMAGLHTYPPTSA